MKVTDALRLVVAGATLSFLLGCSEDTTPRRSLGGGATDDTTATASSNNDQEPTLPGAQPEAPADQQGYVPAPAVPAPQQGRVEFTTGNDRILGDLNGVSTSIQSGDYDSAVNTLAAVSLVPMTPQQEQAYRAQLYQVQQQLLQQAERDPRARQAYQNLGKKMTGR